MSDEKKDNVRRLEPIPGGKKDEQDPLETHKFMPLIRGACTFIVERYVNTFMIMARDAKTGEMMILLPDVLDPVEALGVLEISKVSLLNRIGRVPPPKKDPG